MAKASELAKTVAGGALLIAAVVLLAPFMAFPIDQDWEYHHHW